MTTHKINAGDAQPIQQAPRRILVKKGDEVVRAVSEMEEQEIVESSSSHLVFTRGTLLEKGRLNTILRRL